MARFERLHPHRVLEHPLRERILHHLATHPGANTADVARALDVHHKTAEHHLHALHAHGHAVPVREGRGPRYYPAQWPHPQRRLHAHTRAPTAVTVLHALAPDAERTRGELARELDATESAIRHHVTRLTRLGILTERRDPDGTRRYRLTPAYRDLIPELANTREAA